MATVNVAQGATTLHPAFRPVTYVVEATIDLADVITAKGSALAAADVIEALRIPAKSVVLTAGVEVITAVGGGGTVLTIDVGTGADVDAFADGFDLVAATEGTFSVKAAAGVAAITAGSDTLDVLIATQTGTFTSGVIRVFAVVADLAGTVAPGIAQLKS